MKYTNILGKFFFTAKAVPLARPISSESRSVRQSGESELRSSHVIDYMAACFRAAMSDSPLVLHFKHTGNGPSVRLRTGLVPGLLRCSVIAANFFNRHSTGTILRVHIHLTAEHIHVRVSDNSCPVVLSQATVTATRDRIGCRLDGFGGTCSLFGAPVGITLWFKAQLTPY